MKPSVLLLFALAGLAAAEEARPQTTTTPVPALVAAVNASPMPWLGFSVDPLDDAIRAQVPALPPGIGFMIASVEPGSPAEKAGLKPYDILWKLGDQWIANKAQLYTLLRLRKEGDQTKLSIFRSGQSLELPVTLGRVPENHPGGKPPQLEAGKLVDVPMKVLNPAQSIFQIEAGDGKAILTNVGSVKEVKIVSSEGTVIYRGPLRDENGAVKVPDPWKLRVITLERALASRSGNTPPVPRQPRARIATADPVGAKE